MKLFHLLLGIGMIIIFLLTGQYMDRYLHHLTYTPDVQRMFYRSRHIYILLSGLVNVGLGTYFSYRVERWRQVLQMLGSVLIVLASGLFVAAFIYETSVANFAAPLAGWAMYTIFAGTLFHLLGGLRAKKA